MNFQNYLVSAVDIIGTPGLTIYLKYAPNASQSTGIGKRSGGIEIPKEGGAGGSKTTYFPKKYLVYIENHIENFGEWAKAKLDEDMAGNVSLLEQRIKDNEFENSQLKDKIKRQKESDKKRKQKLEMLIDKAKGIEGPALKQWAMGWRSEILACGETVESFCKLIQDKKPKR